MRESSVEMLAIKLSASNQTNLEVAAELLVHRLGHLQSRLSELYEGR